MLGSNALWKFPYFYWHKPQHFNLAREELDSNPCYKEFVSWDSRVLLMALPFICWMTPGKPFNHHCISLMLLKKKITVCVLESKKTLNIRWSHIIWVGLRNMHGELMFLKLGCWVFFWKKTNPKTQNQTPQKPKQQTKPKTLWFRSVGKGDLKLPYIDCDNTVPKKGGETISVACLAFCHRCRAALYYLTFTTGH